MIRLLPWLWPALFLAIELIRQLVGDTQWWGFLLSRLSEPVWMILALLILIPSLILRKWRPMRWPALASVGVCLLILAPFIRLNQTSPKEGMKGMQLNMQHGLGGVDRVAALIERENPDILCLQEAGPLSYYPKQTPDSLKKALSDYRVFHSTFEAVAVRGEVLKSEIIDLPEATHERELVNQKVITAALVKVKGKVFWLATVHLSPRPDPAKGLIPGATAFAEMRKEQFNRLSKYIESKKEPVVVCGDFNSHAVGPNYRKMRSLMTDAFAAKGQGLGYSINSKVPHKRIDYIYLRGLNPAACRVLPDVVSDHKALVGWFY